MKLSFKNWIAFNFLVTVAIMVGLVFFIIYFTVTGIVFKNLDRDLVFELDKHTHEFYLENDSLKFMNEGEWLEREHLEIEVFPIFIQLQNTQHQTLIKSPNLKADELLFEKEEELHQPFNTQLGGIQIRQVQVPILFDHQIRGYVLAALSLEESLSVIKMLRMTLFILYPFILLILFFTSRILASRSIKPVQSIISTTNQITKHNLNQRVTLPPRKDELYELSSAINELLERIQEAMEREKQFTSDASHELRTPLAVLQGTLEVMLRKPRTPEEYQEKIKSSLEEINRMSSMLNQLLLLARMSKQTFKGEEKDLEILLHEILSRFNEDIQAKSLTVSIKNEDVSNFLLPEFYAQLLLENLISNAIKYSKSGGKVEVVLSLKNDKVNCEIVDDGIGIKAADLSQIFAPFFRSESLNHKDIEGTGLGLSLAKKCAESLGASIQVSSKIGEGTSFLIQF